MRGGGGGSLAALSFGGGAALQATALLILLFWEFFIELFAIASHPSLSAFVDPTAAQKMK